MSLLYQFHFFCLGLGSDFRTCFFEENIQEELDDDPSISFSAKKSEKSQTSDEAAKNGERRAQNGEKSQKDEKGILVLHHYPINYRWF